MSIPDTRTRSAGRRRKATGRLVASLVAAMVAVPVTLFATAPAAHAGPLCDHIGACSEIENPSPYSVYIARDWCDSPGGPCSSNENEFEWLPSGQDTPTNEDWDTFRVDGGWCYKFRMYGADHVIYRTHTYDRRGKGATWIKVNDLQTARIIFQSTSSCG